MSTTRDRVGLCRGCVYARIVPTPRARYWRCALAETDPRFERYPRLPVLACDGYAPKRDEPEGAGEQSREPEN